MAINGNGIRDTVRVLEIKELFRVAGINRWFARLGALHLPWPDHPDDSKLILDPNNAAAPFGAPRHEENPHARQDL